MKGLRVTSRSVATARARLGSRLALVFAAVALVWGSPAFAHADPDAVAKARADVDRLTTEAAAIDQDYAAIQVKLAEGRKKQKAARADVAAQQKKVDAMRATAGRIALAHYQSRDVDPSTQLVFSSDPGSFMSSYATVQQVTATQNSTLQDFQTEQANLAQMQRDAEARTAQISADEAELARLRAESDKKVAAAKAVLDKLSAEERKRLKEEEAKRARENAARANAATSTTDTSTTDTSTRTKTDKSGATSRSADRSATAAGGRGASALAFAKSQIGKPYSYGATGPGAYDCSGLTGAAWRAAGVSLPRTSQAQFGAGRSVSKSELQPGDLVFYYSGISHVGIYAGNGMIVHAPRPGKSVEFAPVDEMPFAGARRPG